MLANLTAALSDSVARLDVAAADIRGPVPLAKPLATELLKYNAAALYFSSSVARGLARGFIRLD